MKASREFLIKRELLDDVFTIRVPSKTVEGDLHNVRIVNNEIRDCDCIGFGIRHKCSHQEIVREYLINKSWKTRKKSTSIKS